MRLAVAKETWPTDGESYIDVHGYVFNEHFKDWRHLVGCQIRGAGHLFQVHGAVASTTSSLPWLMY